MTTKQRLWVDADRPGRRRVALRRARALAVPGGLALLLHAGLLSQVEHVWSANEPAPPVAGMVVETRSLSAPGAAVLPVSVPEPIPTPIPTPTPTPTPTALPAALPERTPSKAARTRPLPAPPPTVHKVLATLAAQTLPAPAPEADVAPSSPSPSSSPDAEVVPVYHTSIAPAVRLGFRLRRGALHGTAELDWRPVPGGYRLRLDARLDGLTLLSQTSDGLLDAGGLAPSRFTDQRARRSALAASFQREAGKITFSGPSTELPLSPGVQDRLSWMIQLAAVVAADPELATPGGRVALQVVGARGDAAVWVLRYAGSDSLTVAGEPLQALKFVREARGPHDTAAEVWLDPQRHHLPVRARLRNNDADAEALELVLQQMVPPP